MNDIKPLTPNNRDRIISILNTPITPENFTNYASSALSNVITALHEVYEKSPVFKKKAYDKSVEDEILASLGFSGRSIIDTLAEKIEQASQVDRVVNLAMGSPVETSESRKIELVLYILLTEFGVDFNDQNQFEIDRGYLVPNQKRTEPYYIITVPVVNSTILVANDKNADTYIFDNKRLRENKIFSAKIKQMSASEDEIETLLSDLPGIGIVIPAKANFASYMMPAIKAAVYDDFINFETAKYDKEHKVALLKNKPIESMPQGYSFFFDLANSLGISTNALNSIIDSISENLGEIKLFKLFIGRIEPCLSPEQQATIRNVQASYGLIPTGFVSVPGFMHNLGINSRIFNVLTNSLIEKIGKIEKYRLNVGGIEDCLSPEQQQMINNAYNNFQMIPNGYVSLSSFAQAKNITLAELNKLIRNQLGSSSEVEMYRMPMGRIEECLSPEQQSALSNTDNDGEGLPQGYVPMTTFSQNLGINDEILTKIIISAGNSFGSISKFQVNLGKVESCLSPDQQQIIRQLYEKYPEMPAGYTPLSIFSASGGHENQVVDRMIEALGEQLGDINLYKTPIGKIDRCLSPNQQQMLNELLNL